VLSPLEDPHIEAAENDDVAWDGARGWLDELAKVAKQRVFEDAREWSSSKRLELVIRENEAEGAPSDSNSDPYMTDWLPQGGRDASVTFDNGCEVGQKTAETGPDQSIEQIEIVLRN